jgi:hypothetical protein
MNFEFIGAILLRRPLVFFCLLTSGRAEQKITGIQQEGVPPKLFMHLHLSDDPA